VGDEVGAGADAGDDLLGCPAGVGCPPDALVAKHAFPDHVERVVVDFDVGADAAPDVGNALLGCPVGAVEGCPPLALVSVPAFPSGVKGVVVDF